MEHYKHVLRSNSEDAVSLDALGCLYGEDERNLGVAISLCEKALAFDEQNENYRLNLARLLYRGGDLKSSLKHLETITSRNSNNKDVLKLKREIEEKLSKVVPEIIDRGKGSLLRNPDLEK